MTHDTDLAILRRAMDQLSGLLDDVRPEVMSHGTPCEAWTVNDLVDHIVAAPTRFVTMMRDEPIDWSAPTPPAGDDPAGAFRSHAQDLLSEWEGQEGPAGLDWQCAEITVHTWDLAAATHQSTGALDPEPAERGLAFMQASLTEENRGPAFGSEQPAPQEADAYQRIAAFAGRSV